MITEERTWTICCVAPDPEDPPEPGNLVRKIAWVYDVAISVDALGLVVAKYECPTWRVVKYSVLWSNNPEDKL